MASRTAERVAAGLLMVGFPGTAPTAELEDAARRGVRSFILFSRNLEAASEVRDLTDRLRELAGVNSLIAVDQEGGAVVRLDRAATSWPSQMALAATRDVEAARLAALTGARQLSALGINLNLAPVADLLGDARNPVIGTRAFSDDPELAAAFTVASVQGHQAGGVAATAKHFPGHGATPVDSHEELPTVERDLDRLASEDLAPFEAAVEAGVDCMMSSHVWYPGLDPVATPATLSSAVVHLARDRLGFRGVLMTDCMEMGAIQRHMTTGQAAVHAVAAGYDLVAVSHRHDRQMEAMTALRDAIEAGVVTTARAEEAGERVEGLCDRLAGPTSLETVDGDQLAQALAARAVTLIQDRDGFLPLRPRPPETVGIVCFPPLRSSGVEGRSVRQVLADRLGRRHPHVRDVEIPLGHNAPRTALEAMSGVDIVLVATAFAMGRPAQDGVVQSLLSAGKRVIVMAVRDPFDLLAFPDAPCFLAVYGELPVSLEAGVAVIFGEAEAPGRLPVALEGLYARGHGISLAARPFGG